jgi:hypothetical protein
MTTPTTGTAPLIERLAKAYARFVFDRHIDALHGPTRADCYKAAQAFLDVLGDGIWIEREQARETIADALFSLGDREDWDMGEATNQIIAGLAGEERP